MDSQNLQSVIDVVKTNLAPVIEATKEAGGLGWELMVSKVFWIDGVVELSSSVITVAIVFGIAWAVHTRFSKFATKMEEGEKSEYISMRKSDWGFGRVLVGGTALFVSALFLITALSDSLDAAKRIALPEYYAIMEIVDMAK